MASLPRKTSILFLGNKVSTPSNFIAQFGSQAAGSPLFSADPAVIQALTAWLNGWADATIPIGSPPQPVPPEQDMNALFFVAFYQLCYLLDRGIAEYDVGTTYGQFSFAQVAGVVYRSKVSNNTGHDPTSSPTQWQDYGALFDAAGAAAGAQTAAENYAATVATAAQTAAESYADGVAATAQSNAESYTNAQIVALAPALVRAYIIFNGVSMGVFDSFNVYNITKDATGTYTVYYSGTSATAPCVSGQAGTYDNSGGGGIIQVQAGVTAGQFQFIASTSTGGGFFPRDHDYVSVAMHTAS